MSKISNPAQKAKMRLIALGRKTWTAIIKHSIRFLEIVILLVAINVTLLILGPIVIDGLAQATHTLVEHICPEFLNNDWVSYINYYVAIIILVNTVVIIIWCCNHRNVKRNAAYLLKTLHSDNERLPAVDVEQLVERITGLETPSQDATAYDEVYAMVLGNINPIVDFLNNDINNGAVLMINAPWGAGKTTAILIAISLQQGRDNIIHRYIYESAFKYTDNTGDFGHDLVSALCDTLSEFGIDIQKSFIGIMRNIEFSSSKLFPSLLNNVHQKSNDRLTTELIHEVNLAYHRRLKMGSNHLEVVIILDDTDRLQGDDLIKALSLLSIMRRLDFVKIIVPVDPLVIVQQLQAQCQIINPEKFIKKYLTDQSSVKLKTDEEIVEQIALQKIKSLHENPPTDGTDFCAAWAAIILRLVADRLHRFSDGLQDFNMQWLGRNEGTIYGSVIIKPGQFSELLRDSSNIMDRIVRDTTDSYGQKYTWPKSLDGDARNFEDIVLKVLRKKGGTPTIQKLTEDEYDELVASWIFDFARRNWIQIDATLRDVLDLILANDFSNLSLNRADQFKQALGILFPESVELIWGIE